MDHERASGLLSCLPGCCLVGLLRRLLLQRSTDAGDKCWQAALQSWDTFGAWLQAHPQRREANAPSRSPQRTSRAQWGAQPGWAAATPCAAVPPGPQPLAAKVQGQERETATHKAGIGRSLIAAAEEEAVDVVQPCRRTLTPADMMPGRATSSTSRSAGCSFSACSTASAPASG